MEPTSIAAAMMMSTQAATRSSIEMVLAKKNHEADQAIVGLLQQAIATTETLQAAPPAGTGTIVDLTA